MRFALFLLALCCVNLATQAEGQAQETQITNGAGGFACLSEAAHDEMIEAIAAKNMSWLRSMLGGGQCFQMKQGLSATIKDYSMWGTSEIYLHPPDGGRPVAVWTVNENLDPPERWRVE